MAWRRTGDKPLPELIADQVHWRIYAALGGDKLMKISATCMVLDLCICQWTEQCTIEPISCKWLVILCSNEEFFSPKSRKLVMDLNQKKTLVHDVCNDLYCFKRSPWILVCLLVGLAFLIGKPDVAFVWFLRSGHYQRIILHCVIGLLPDTYKIAGCACAGTAGNVFPVTDFNRLGNR